MVGFRHVLQCSAALDWPPQHPRRTMPSAADLRTAITAANTGVADAAQQIMLADAAATLLPDPVTVSKLLCSVRLAGRLPTLAAGL